MKFTLRFDDGEYNNSLVVQGPEELKKVNTNTVRMGEVFIYFHGEVLDIEEIDEQKELEEKINKMLQDVPMSELDLLLPALVKEMEHRRKEQAWLKKWDARLKEQDELIARKAAKLKKQRT